jgi:hypothetical protein
MRDQGGEIRSSSILCLDFENEDEDDDEEETNGYPAI